MTDQKRSLAFRVGAAQAALRLDQYLPRVLPSVSRGSIRRLIARRLVRVDGRVSGKGLRLKEGARVEVSVAVEDESPVSQPEFKLDYIAHTPAAIVINKPPFCACYPHFPGELDTVANGLLASYPECAEASIRPREGGLVHRLDYGTSGVLVAARSRKAYTRLREHFRAQRVVKQYLAVVHGSVAQSGVVDLRIATDRQDKRRVTTHSDQSNVGQRAYSEYAPIVAGEQYSSVRLTCFTGRRHQVRAHMGAIGHPLVGDVLYGSSTPQLRGALLHASRIEIEGEAFEAPVPEERARWMEEHGLRPPREKS